MKFLLQHDLSRKEEGVIVDKLQEYPFTGKYDDFYKDGTYICRRCNSPLYSAKTKFDAGCGWPAFDENFPDAVQRLPDPDGSRTEIVCSHCEGHLGHVFDGEGFTEKDTRHCVNSISLKFIPIDEDLPPILEKD